jgi:hypothetical protein
LALEHEALTERIIGAAIEVHRRLGPGFLESVYEKALAPSSNGYVTRTPIHEVG